MEYRTYLLSVTLILSISLSLHTISAAGAETELISTNVAYWNHVYNGSISGNGRFVAFHSSRNDLVSGDTNYARDVFVQDRQTGTIKRVSVNSNGLQANNHSIYPTISSDGRYVVFNSSASNLVDGDLNGTGDVLVHDMQTGQTTLVSVSSTGVQGGGGSYPSAISADGNIIAFDSSSTNLVANDTNNLMDIFVHDRQTGQTTRVNVDSSGNQADRESRVPAMSADGRYITFSSYASNLVPGGTSTYSDIFVHDRQTGETSIVSINSNGFSGNSDSSWPSISANGRFIVFSSLADNLVSDDTNGAYDIFRYDRETDTLERISVDSLGRQTNGPAGPVASNNFWSYISSSGEYVAFESTAVNLVENDPNGGGKDMFIKNMVTGQVIRVDFVPFKSYASSTALRGFSADGNYIVFSSIIENPVMNDPRVWAGIFTHGPLLVPEEKTTGFVPAIPAVLLLAKP